MRDLLTIHLEQVEARLAEQRDTHRRLLHLAEVAENTDPANCAPESVCRILWHPAGSNP